MTWRRSKTTVTNEQLAHHVVKVRELYEAGEFAKLVEMGEGRRCGCIGPRPATDPECLCMMQSLAVRRTYALVKLRKLAGQQA